MKRLFILILATVALASCGRYYNAEIAGYIKDASNGNGINGAIVRMYLNEPDSADSPDFIAETSSMTSGGNDGYYNHKIIWVTMNPEFGDEGDSGTIWIGVTQEDYVSKVVQVSGIISDTLNVVPDIQLERATFSSPTVTGHVVNVNGEGVNGVRVVLDLQSTTDTDSDYVTTTTTINNEPGSYRFNNVTWRDENPDSSDTDTENVTIYIDDPDYTSSSSITAQLTSGQDNDIPDDLVVTRKPRTNFSTNVAGSCIERIVKTDNGEIQNIPLKGINVTITYSDDNGSHTVTDVTDANGNYSILVQWTHATTSSDPEVPEGEDKLILTTVTYDDPSGVYTFTNLNNIEIKSWINPNYLPDAEGTHS